MSVITPNSRRGTSSKLPSFNINDYLKPVVGRVAGIILEENTPNETLYNKYGKEYGVGTIFYNIYSSTNNNPVTDVDSGENLNGNTVIPARPFFANDKQYPLLGELVYILQLPNPKSVTSNSSTFSYYLGPINLWNNSQTNPQFTNQEIFLGNKFEQRSDIPTLKVFEGDKLIEGRYNAGIRFSNSNLLNNNFWNRGKQSGDPVLIFTNGYNPTKNNVQSSNLYSEDINNDNSTILLTSTQTIPLNTTVTTSNPFTKTILPKNYSGNAQIILNSDRLVFNTKKDDILLYSQTNTEVYAKQDITLNAENDIILNSKHIILGIQTPDKPQYPTQPAVLGTNLEDILCDLAEALASFGNSLTSTVSTPAGSPLVTVNTAGSSLSDKILDIVDKIEGIKSKSVFIKSND